LAGVVRVRDDPMAGNIRPAAGGSERLAQSSPYSFQRPFTSRFVASSVKSGLQGQAPVLTPYPGQDFWGEEIAGSAVAIAGCGKCCEILRTYVGTQPIYVPCRME